MTLTEFLLARLADDEAAAQKKAGTLLALNSPERPVQMVDSPFSPSRVLAECEAKRRIVEEHRPTRDGSFCGCCWLDDLGTWEPHPCPTLRALALPFADHPDYREEWTP